MAHNPELERLKARRRFLIQATTGTVIAAMGGSYVLSDDLTRVARAETRRDGRSRLPPGQRVIESLKPMGGEPGDPSLSRYRLRVHGDVESAFEIGYSELTKLGDTDRPTDVHCVTGWSVLGARFTGVKLATLAKRAGVKSGARYVIFEAAHGYTANVPLREALSENVLLAWKLEGASLARAHGGPVRAVVPDLYFWKSAKWLTGIRFSTRDEPGYWETRGYHNHGDPWREERHG